jgi:hypothetical protein
MPDGTDVPFNPDDEMPEGALFDMPAVRVERVFSADFVSDPAANASGLFSERHFAAARLLGIELKKPVAPVPVDAPAKPKTSTIPNMLKDLRQAFPDSAQFSRACDLLAADDKLTVADISAKLAAEKEADRVAGIEADLAALKVQLAAKDAEIVQLKADVVAKEVGTAPINLGTGDAAPVDTDAIVAQYLKLSGADAQGYLAKHIGVINAQRKAHGSKGRIG